MKLEKCALCGKVPRTDRVDGYVNHNPKCPLTGWWPSSDWNRLQRAIRAKLRKSRRPGKALARLWWGPGCLCTEGQPSGCVGRKDCRRVEVVEVPKRRAGR